MNRWRTFFVDLLIFPQPRRVSKVFLSITQWTWKRLESLVVEVCQKQLKHMYRTRSIISIFCIYLIKNLKKCTSLMTIKLYGYGNENQAFIWNWSHNRAYLVMPLLVISILKMVLLDFLRNIIEYCFACDKLCKVSSYKLQKTLEVLFNTVLRRSKGYSMTVNGVVEKRRSLIWRITSVGLSNGALGLKRRRFRQDKNVRFIDKI